jgi:hypothetical protein
MDVYTHVFLNSALVGGKQSTSCPDLFTPVETVFLLTSQEVWWTPVPAWMAWKHENSSPGWDSNYDPSAVQPIASHYAHYTTLAHS